MKAERDAAFEKVNVGGVPVSWERRARREEVRREVTSDCVRGLEGVEGEGGDEEMREVR